MKESLKKPLKILIAIVIIVSLIFAGLKVYDYLQNTLPPTQVDIIVQYLPKSQCRPDSPLYIAVTNNSHRKINNIEFSLSVKNENNGDNLIKATSSTYSKHRIIRPDEKYEGCWSFPKLKTRNYLAENLIFEVKRKNISFGD